MSSCRSITSALQDELANGGLTLADAQIPTQVSSSAIPFSTLSPPACVSRFCPTPFAVRDLNALLQRLSADLEEARTTAENEAKRLEASTSAAGEKDAEVRRLADALAAVEAKLTASDR